MYINHEINAELNTGFDAAHSHCRRIQCSNANQPIGPLGKRQGSQPVPSSNSFRSVSDDSIPSKGLLFRLPIHVHTIINGENFKLCKADSTVTWHIVDPEVDDPYFQKPVHLSGSLTGHQLLS